MDDAHRPDDPARSEDPTSDGPRGDSVDEEFRTLLEGLRTTLPGAETLVGFLLIIPLQGAFQEFDTLERGTYYTAFFASALAVVLLIAPAAHQRIRAPISGVSRRSARHLRITVWLTIAGTLSMAAALTAAVFLVSRIVFSSTVAGVASAFVVAITAWAWFYVPIVTFDERR